MSFCIFSVARLAPCKISYKKVENFCSDLFDDKPHLVPYSRIELNLRMVEFELPVSVNEKEFLFPSKLVQLGYTYRIEVDVNGAIVSFERDEERNWRALINNENRTGNIEPAVINAIIETLDSL